MVGGGGGTVEVVSLGRRVWAGGEVEGALFSGGGVGGPGWGVMPCCLAFAFSRIIFHSFSPLRALFFEGVVVVFYSVLDE